MRPIKIRIILSSALILLFIAMAALTLSGALSGFESGVYDGIAGSINPSLTLCMRILTVAGSWYALILLSPILILFKKTRKKLGYPAAFALLCSLFLNNVLKHIFRRARPDILPLEAESGFSFPSGHAQNSAAFFIAVAVLLIICFKNYKRIIPLVAGCVLIPLVVAFTRVYLGVHYAGDVLAGLALGAAIALGTSVLWDMLDAKTKRFTKFHALFFEEGSASTENEEPKTNSEG
ncbi:MAG: phosphatase PAP2 family protein [Firmicutes bacterium]|nr:phosphatase PAP2 family protein [Bacillota bacterium]